MCSVDEVSLGDGSANLAHPGRDSPRYLSSRVILRLGARSHGYALNVYTTPR